MTKKKRIAVLITTDLNKRGVFFGYIDPADAAKETIKVYDARMAIYWDSTVRGVLGLAADGPNERCNISKAPPSAIVHGVTLVSEVSKKAEKAWLKEYWGRT